MRLWNAANSFYTQVKAGSIAANTSFILPPDNGTNGYVLQTDGAGNTTWVSAGGGFSWATPVNANIVPSTDATYDIGSASLRFDEIFGRFSRWYSSNTGSETGQIRAHTFTVPGGQTSHIRLTAVGSGNNLGVHSITDATADAVATGAVYIQTGNKTAGTGASGEIHLQTGTSSGGARGNIFLNANQITVTSTNIVPSTNNVNTIGSNFNQWNIVYGRYFLSHTTDFAAGSNFNTGLAAVFQSGHSNTSAASGTATFQSGDQLTSGTGTVGQAIFRSGNTAVGNTNPTGSVTMKSGDAIGSGASGPITISSGTSTVGTGTIFIDSGSSSGTGSSGDIRFRSGAKSAGTGSTGAATFGSGVNSITTNNTGVVTLASGNSTVTGGGSGGVFVQSGDVTGSGSLSGSVTIQSGLAPGGSRGVVNISGVQINTTGNIIPAADGVYTVGTNAGAINFLSVYSRQFLSEWTSGTLTRFGSGFNRGNPVNFESGTANSPGVNTGDVIIQAGNVLNGNTTGTAGRLFLYAAGVQHATNTNAGGLISMETRGILGLGASGAITIKSGDITNVSSTANTGSISITTGTTTGSGTRGNIVLNANGVDYANARAVSNFFPKTTDIYDFGDVNNRWRDVWALNFKTGGFTIGLQTTPSGAAGVAALGTNNILDAGIFTGNSAVADAAATRFIVIETGNKTAGTGNSGDITLRTGTSAGGTRGDILFNSRRVDFSNTTMGSGLNPAVDNLYDIGNITNYFRNVYTYKAIGAGWALEYNPTGTGSPSGTAYTLHFATAANAAIYTDNNASGGTSNIYIDTGNSTGTTGTTGFIRLRTGIPGSSSGDSGELQLFSGNAAAGNSGDIALQTGTASGTRGSIILNATDVQLTNRGYLGLAPGAQFSAWGSDIPGLVFDTAGSDTSAAFGGGLMFLGDSNNSLAIMTNDQTGSTGSATFYWITGQTVDGASGSVDIRSGNCTGTGNSGDILLAPGSVSSGVRGRVRVDGRTLRIPKHASAPTATESGEMYYDTTTNKSYTWDGSTWQAHW
jgi:hypothetical protein